MKNTLMILIVSAILGAMVVGCGQAPEGNTDNTATGNGALPTNKEGAQVPVTDGGTNAPAANNEEPKK